MDINSLKELIRTVPDYPKEGIMFRDITTLIGDPEGLKATIDALAERYKDYDIDYVAGIESRGFIIGTPLAIALGKGFIPIRKKGKLPFDTITQEITLEYGTDTIEIHKDALKPGQRILMVDDLMATGGTVMGGIDLIEKCGGKVVEACFVIDLPDLKGGERLEKRGIPFFKLIDFEGD
jgi:adenine phosphoribosyltransferase